jgi:hypothetical protein
MSRRVAALVLPADTLGALLISRLLLALLTIAHDALIMAAGRLWHRLLAAMFATLIPRAFEVVFLWHCDQTLCRCRTALLMAPGG